jgi:hypothetical protein
MHTTHNPELALYLSSLFSSLRGWCYPQVWEAVTPLADTIAKSIPSATLAKLGVHHKGEILFIGLDKSLNWPGINYAFDSFNDRSFNLDPTNQKKLSLVLVGHLYARQSVSRKQCQTYSSNHERVR